MVLCAVALYSILLFAVAASIAFSWVGDLTLTTRLFVACFTLLALVAALNWLIRQRKITRLDISMNGQIRLVEHNDLTDMPFSVKDKSGGNTAWRLMSDSLLWSDMLLLRLESEAHKLISLIILRDSMNAQAFRALSVACRWIAAQNKPTDGEPV